MNSGGFFIRNEKGGFRMKNIIAVCATAYVATGFYPAQALSLIDPGDDVACINCRADAAGDGTLGECLRYDSTCCEPCKTLPVVPTTCKPSNCSGQTVNEYDTCIQTSTKGCVNDKCTTTTTTSCKAGYYGSSPKLGVGLDLTKCSGCTKCPSSGGIAGDSVPGDNGTITKCFIPAGTAFSDASGSGTYTDNCYYQN